MKIVEIGQNLTLLMIMLEEKMEIQVLGHLILLPLTPMVVMKQMKELIQLKKMI